MRYTRNYRFRVWFLGLLVTTSLAGVYGLALLFANTVSSSQAVNFSKRIAAETAAIFLRVYDPFAESYKIAVSASKDSSRYLGGEWLRSKKEIESFLTAHPGISQKVTFLSFSNGSIGRSVFPFYYQPYGEKILGQLRVRYNLEEVVEKGQDEFAKMVLLRDWVHQQWMSGSPGRVDFNFNALDILERGRHGEKFFCSEYATTYVQTAVSLGWTARYVGLFKGHVVAEIWSNKWAKWVVMDPQNNIHYEDEGTGVPLNALELRNLWLSQRWRNAQLTYGPSGSVNGTSLDSAKYNLIDFYTDFYVRMRNDWFSNRLPHWHPLSNSIMNGVEWVDGRSSDNILIARETADSSDLYWPLNQVYIGLKFKDEPERIRLKFDTLTPNFSHFLLAIDGGTSRKWTTSTFEWYLHEGENRLEIVPINAFHARGRSSSLTLQLKKPVN